LSHRLLFAGLQKTASRKYVIPQNMTVEYLVGDHLGSTSLTTDASGAIKSLKCATRLAPCAGAWGCFARVR
jgi:hypothetical protein